MKFPKIHMLIWGLIVIATREAGKKAEPTFGACGWLLGSTGAQPRYIKVTKMKPIRSKCKK